jgi:hypothetical protein
MSKEKPYIVTKKQIIVTTRTYNPKYGDDRICVCGHPYYRHFDTYENMDPVGCKYCGCPSFREKTTKEPMNVFLDENGNYDPRKVPLGKPGEEGKPSNF